MTSFMNRGGQQQQNPNQLQLHGGDIRSRFYGGGSAPSQQFGQQSGQGQQPQGQQNDFMSQLRQYMQQMPQQQQQQQPQGGQPGQQMSQMFGMGGGQHPGGVAAGDFLAEAFARDYANQAAARQQMGNTMGGFLEGIRGIPAMGMMGVDMARQAGQQGMNVAREGMERMTKEAGAAKDVANQARKDVQGATGVMAGAIKQQEFFRKDTVASGVNGIQSQFQSAKEQIMSNPNLSDEDKQVEMDKLNNTMRQQTSAYAAQADAQAADSLLQAKNALAGLKMQGAGLTSGVGMQAAGMGMQAAQAGYQLMNAQSQFASSLAQSAMAQAINANLSGNTVGAQIAMNMPLGAPNIADTILAMMNAQGMRPGTETTGLFAGRIAGLVGQPGFGGYAEPKQPVGFGRPSTYRVPGAMFG
jgi:hypothetical protein